MVGHAPVINKPRHHNRGRAHRVAKAAAKKQTLRIGGVVVPRRGNKKVHQIEKRLRHHLADEKQRLATAELLDAVASEMDIDDGLTASSLAGAAKVAGKARGTASSSASAAAASASASAVASGFATPGGAAAAAAVIAARKKKKRRGSTVATMLNSAAAIAALAAASGGARAGRRASGPGAAVAAAGTGEGDVDMSSGVAQAARR